jgi:uncharacterized protein YdeI (BOF family)
MKMKHFTLMFSIIGILFLFFVSRMYQPPLIAINQMPNYQDKQVIIEGTVIEYHLTKYSSQIITIENNNATTTVFVEGMADIEFGDKIQVTGDVQKYKEGWEIVVNNVNQVKILEKWSNISIPLWQLADNPLKYINLNIQVNGYIDSISNSYFYLTDLEKNHFLPVFYELEKNVTISPGQKICIQGKFSFDKENLRYKIEIIEEIHGITLLGD